MLRKIRIYRLWIICSASKFLGIDLEWIKWMLISRVFAILWENRPISNSISQVKTPQRIERDKVVYRGKTRSVLSILRSIRGLISSSISMPLWLLIRRSSVFLKSTKSRSNWNIQPEATVVVSGKRSAVIYRIAGIAQIFNRIIFQKWKAKKLISIVRLLFMIGKVIYSSLKKIVKNQNYHNNNPLSS